MTDARDNIWGTFCNTCRYTKEPNGSTVWSIHLGRPHQCTTDRTIFIIIFFLRVFRFRSTPSETNLKHSNPTNKMQICISYIYIRVYIYIPIFILICDTVYGVPVTGPVLVLLRLSSSFIMLPCKDTSTVRYRVSVKSVSAHGVYLVWIIFCCCWCWCCCCCWDDYDVYIEQFEKYQMPHIIRTATSPISIISVVTHLWSTTTTTKVANTGSMFLFHIDIITTTTSTSQATTMYTLS